MKTNVFATMLICVGVEATAIWLLYLLVTR